MEHINKNDSLIKFMAKLKELYERNEKEKLQTKEELKNKLFHLILNRWHQHHSIFFWQKLFNSVDIEIIYDVYKHIEDLINSGYPVKNPAGLFVSHLKRLGYIKCSVNNDKININEDKER